MLIYIDILLYVCIYVCMYVCMYVLKCVEYTHTTYKEWRERRHGWKAQQLLHTHHVLAQELVAVDDARYYLSHTACMYVCVVKVKEKKTYLNLVSLQKKKRRRVCTVCSSVVHTVF